ncbi:membrane protein [soil metagenome]
MKLPAALRRVPPKAGVMAGALIAMGVLHFVAPRPFDSIIPRVLPEATRRPLTYASGAAEIVCGVLLLMPRTRALGGRLTMVLLVLVLPANVDAALRGGYPIDGVLGSPAAAWLRVPLQIPMIMVARSIESGARAATTGRQRTPD